MWTDPSGAWAAAPQAGDVHTVYPVPSNSEVNCNKGCDRFGNPTQDFHQATNNLCPVGTYITTAGCGLYQGQVCAYVQCTRRRISSEEIIDSILADALLDQASE